MFLAVRHARFDAGPAPGGRGDVEHAARGPGSLPHVLQPQTPSPRRRFHVHAVTVVGDLQHEVGSLEPGKRADIVIRSNDTPEAWPRHNIIRHQLLLAKARTVDTVLVDGEVLVKGGRLTRMDESAIYETADAAARTMRKRAGLR